MTTKLTAAPKHLLTRQATTIDDYGLDEMRIADAQVLFRFSKSEFFRFRDRHRIRTLPGRRIHLLDIVNAFEAERGVPPSERSCPDPQGYAALLLKLVEASSKLQVSRRTCCRFRAKHKVPTLSGGFLHTADLIKAMEAERVGLKLK